MKTLLAAALATSLVAALPVQAADVGVSVSISQPGVYGRIDLGRFPQPQLVVAQPVIIQRPVRVVQAPEPVYMWVPPGHRKNWRQHCGRYQACGVPVYFVRDDWYDREVKGHGKKDKGHGHKDKDRGHDDHGDHRGNGRG
jgi:hypothetical protein